MRWSKWFGAPMPFERAGVLASFEPMFARQFEDVERELSRQAQIIDSKSSLLLASAALLVAIALVFMAVPAPGTSSGALKIALNVHITLCLLAIVLLARNLYPNWQEEVKAGDRPAFEAYLRNQIRVFCLRAFRYAAAWWLFMSGLVIGAAAILIRVWLS